MVPFKAVDKHFSLTHWTWYRVFQAKPQATTPHITLLQYVLSLGFIRLVCTVSSMADFFRQKIHHRSTPDGTHE